MRNGSPKSFAETAVPAPRLAKRSVMSDPPPTGGATPPCQFEPSLQFWLPPLIQTDSAFRAVAPPRPLAKQATSPTASVRMGVFTISEKTTLYLHRQPILLFKSRLDIHCDYNHLPGGMNPRRPHVRPNSSYGPSAPQS